MFLDKASFFPFHHPLGFLPEHHRSAFPSLNLRWGRVCVCKSPPPLGMKQYSQILGRHGVQPELLMALGTAILSPSPQATSGHGSPGGHQTRRGPLQQLPEGVLRWGHINNLEETASGSPSLSPVINIMLFRETLRFQTTSYLISNHAPFQKSFQEKH